MFAGTLLVASPAHASVVSGTINGVTYNADSANVAAGATATAYNVASGPVVAIPATVNLSGTDYVVTAIGDGAFDSKSLTSVTMPDTVASIGELAFHHNLLASIDLPAALATVRYAAFSDNKLTALVIPTGVTTVEESAFDTNLLTNVTIPSTLTVIDDLVFNNNRFTSVTIPNTVTSIGERAFAQNWLQSVVLSDHLTTMGGSAFFTNAITSITIPSSLTAIPSGAFEQNLLTSVTIPPTVTSIGTSAFSSNKLTSISIPGSVTDIPSRAFGDNLLTSVTIPGSVTNIALKAFINNLDLISVKFLGNAPTIYPADPGAPDPLQSLPANPNLVLHYLSSKSGYTSPAWQGYKTMKELRTTLVGTPREGRVLTAVPNQTAPASITLAYRWYADGVRISGAAAKTLTLGKAQAGRRIAVAVVASSPGGAYTEQALSASTPVISSLYKRLVLSTYQVHRGHAFTVTATGLKPHQKVRISLNNTTRFTGYADRYGTISRSVTFTSNTKSGKRSVKVKRQVHGTYLAFASTSVRYYR